MSRPRMLTVAVALLVAVPLVAPAGGQAPDLSPVDCVGPAGDPEPGTPEFAEQDTVNMYCTQERRLDQAQHPSAALPADEGATRFVPDAYRDPRRHDGVRFRFTGMTVEGLTAEVYRPCAEGTCADVPEPLETFEPPYPAVLVLHGGSSRKEFHWWASQPLAERGYFVIAYDGATSAANIQTVLAWLHDPDNPFAGEVDLDRVGIAGHSAGGAAAITTQGDPRISAIVIWDSNSGGQFVEDDPTHVTPTMFQSADHRRWWDAPGGISTWHPRPRFEVEDTVTAPGFEVLRERGADSMVPTLRATTHLDWVGSLLWGNRLAELVNVYYQNAWFDRYLKGRLVLSGAETAEEEAAERAYRQAVAEEAFARLVADAFDDSADRHNLSQGFWDTAQAATSGDPLFGGNVPYAIEGLAVADRLAFYHRSVCFLSVPDYSAGTGAVGDPVLARVDSDNMRADGCRP